MRSRVGRALVVAALGASLVACAGKQAAPTAAPAPAATPASVAEPATPGEVPGGRMTARAEIDQLDRAIDDQRGQLGLPAAPPPACAATASCATIASAPMSVAPTAEDPQCRPGPGTGCKDACTLADSICASARRICEIAAMLGGADAYANETCAKGKASCDAARARCCGCT